MFDINFISLDFSLLPIHTQWRQSKQVRKFKISWRNFEKFQNLHKMKKTLIFYVICMQHCGNFKNIQVRHVIEFNKIWKEKYKIHKNEVEKAVLKVELLFAPEIYFMIKVVFFQKKITWHMSVQQNWSNGQNRSKKAKNFIFTMKSEGLRFIKKTFLQNL